MPWGQPKQASSATTSLIYITVGALTVVWTVIRYIYLSRHEESENAFLWNHGFLMSGLVLLIIGLALGRIGRAARAAEVTPSSAGQAVVAPPAVASPAGVVPTAQVAPVAPAPPPQYTSAR